MPLRTSAGSTGSVAIEVDQTAQKTFIGFAPEADGSDFGINRFKRFNDLRIALARMCGTVSVFHFETAVESDAFN